MLPENLRLYKKGTFADIYMDISEPDLLFKLGNIQALPVLKTQYDVLKRLKHPSFLKVFKWYQEEDKCGYSMERIKGISVDKWIKEHKGDTQLITNLLINILLAIEKMHSRGIVHGDIKPSHIIMTSKGIKIIDPGLGSDIITPTYAAPESIFGEFSPSTDIYSIGMIFYTSITGIQPFTGSIEGIIKEKFNKIPEPINRLVPEIPSNLSRIIMGMIEPSPMKRFTSVNEVLWELKRGKLGEEVNFFYPLFVGRKGILEDFRKLIEKKTPFLYLIYGEEGTGRKTLLKEMKKLSAGMGISTSSIDDYNFNSIISNKKGWVFFVENVDVAEKLLMNIKNIKGHYNNSFVLRLNSVPEVSTGMKTVKLKLPPLEPEDIGELIEGNYPGMSGKEPLIDYLYFHTGGNPEKIRRTMERIIKNRGVKRKGRHFVLQRDKLPELKPVKTKLSKDAIKILKLLSVFTSPVNSSILNNSGIKEPFFTVKKLIGKGYIMCRGNKIWIENEETKREIKERIDEREFSHIVDMIYSSREILPPENVYPVLLPVKRKEGIRFMKRAFFKFLNEGNILFCLRVTEEMRTFLREGLHHLIKARVYEIQGDYYKAYDEFGFLPEWLKNIEYVKYRMIADKRLSGRIEGVESEIKKFLKVSSRFRDSLLYHLGRLYGDMDRIKEAEELLKEFGKKDINYLRLKSYIEIKREKWDELLETSRRGIEISGINERPIFLNALGIAQKSLGKLNGAEKTFTELIELSRGTGNVNHLATALTNMGFLTVALKGLREAINYLGEAVNIFRAYKKDKQLEYVSSFLISYHYNIGEYKMALEIIRELKEEFSPLPPSLIEEEFFTYLFMGDLEKAEMVLNTIGRDSPFYPLGLSYIHFHKGEYSLSFDRMKEALSHPDNIQPFYIILFFSLTYLLNRDIGLAVKLSKKLSPSYPVINEIIHSFGKGDLEGLKTSGKRIASLGFYRIGGIIFMAIGSSYIERGEINKALESLKVSENLFERVSVTHLIHQVSRLVYRCAENASSLTGRTGVLSELEKLISMIDREDRIDSILLELTRFLGAERGAIIQMKGDKPVVLSAMGIDETTMKDAGWLSRTIARKGSRGEILVVEDAQKDRRLSKLRSISRNNIRSILCVPIFTGGDIFGVIYLDSTLKRGIFQNEDRDFLLAFGRIIGVLIQKGIFLENIIREKERMERMLGLRENFYGIVGVSQGIKRIISLIQRFAPTEESILITGETGTGKELVANVIHRLSRRSEGPFVIVECSSIQESIFESELFGHKKGSFTGAIMDKKGLCETANGGTLFLDEVGDIPLNIQPKILRLTEKGEIRRIGETRWRKVDIRLISATNKDLESAIWANTFRQDLYYRLKGIEIHIPPLRERKEDIPVLLNHYLKIALEKTGKRIMGFTKDALEILSNYYWPGNVRELIKFVNSVVTVSDHGYIGSNNIPEEIKLRALPESLKLKDTENILMKEVIIRALNISNWNKTKAAQYLNISRRHLYRLIKKYNIKK